MTILNIEDSLVLIIDVQEKLLNAVFNKASLEKRAEIIAGAAKILGIPVIVTEQYPKGLGATIEGLKNTLADDTQYFEKTAFSALENQEVLVITKNGFGKKTPIEEYRITNRGGKGVKTVNITEKTGCIVSFEIITSSDEDVMLVTNEGIIIRIDANQISTMSRVTQGVKLINLKDNQFVSTVTVVEKSDSNECKELNLD